MGNNLDPNIKPEKTCKSHKGNVEKPCIGQGRAGVRRRRSAPINQTIISPSETVTEKKIETGKTNLVNCKDPMHSVNNMDEGMKHTNPLLPDVPFHPGPTYRPPPKNFRSHMPRSQESSQSSPSPENISSEINLDFG